MAMPKKKTLRVNGQEQEHSADKTIRELKKDIGIPSNDAVVYNDGKEERVLGDKDRVEHMPDGSSVASVMKPGMLQG